MTRHMDMNTLVAEGHATVVAPIRSKKELLLICAGAFDESNPVARFFERFLGQRSFRTLYQTERMPDDMLRAKKTAGNVFAPAVEALEQAGIRTDGTVGGFMDVTGLSAKDIHDVSCYCHTGERVTRSRAGDVFRNFAARA